MLLAAVSDTPYDIVLFLHIVTALVAFSPVFVHPLVSEQVKQLGDADRRSVLAMLVSNGRRVYAPALIVTGLLGFALQGMSDGVWSFSQAWMWLAAVVWVAMNGILHAVLLPAEQAVADGDDAAASRVTAAGVAITALLLVIVYLMIFKPGL